MNCKLTRLHQLKTGIFSLLDVGSVRFYVAEHAYPTPLDTWAPKLPPGTYTCIRYYSPKHGYEVFEVTDVPGCSFIEFHIGNYPQQDSDGCLLLGEEISLDNVPPMVTNSKIAFDRFMLLQSDVKEFILEVC